MAIFNSFTFDNENSLDSGIYITGEAVFNAPKRVVEMVNVPGRNGAIAIDEGRFENIPVKYPAGCFADNMADFAEKVANFRNILASRFTYKRLEDTYYPDEFRMGLYRSGLEVDVVNQARAGKFDIEFDCKPQRFLKSGEKPVEYTPGQTPSDEQTKTGSIVTFEAEEGTIISGVKADINPVQDLHGYDKPWAGGNGKNIFDIDSIGSMQGLSESDGVFTNTAIDSIGFTFCVQQYNGSSYVKQSPKISVTSTGRASTTIVIDSTITMMRIKHNGAQTDLFFDIPFTKQGTFTISIDVLAYNTSTVGGLKFKEVQIEEGSTMTSYEPYSNICPISGWTECDLTRDGINLLSSPMELGSINNNGDNSDADNRAMRSVSFIDVFPNTTYTYSQESNSGEIWANYYKDGVFLRRTNIGRDVKTATFTVPAEANQVRMRCNLASEGVMIGECQLEFGSTATDYEPYNGNTYTISLGGTRYDGILDVTSGMFIGTRKFDVFDGSSDETWTYISTYQGIRLTLSDANIDGIPSEQLLSDSYVGNYVRGNKGYEGSGIMKTYASTSDNTHVFFTSDISDVSTWRTYLASNPIQLVYPLATPLTVQLTPTEVKTLLGTNNIWADSGDITVKYGTNPYIIVNPTDFPSKPLLEVTGVGSFWLGDTQFTITGTSGQIIYIDCETGECYKVTGGIISPANGLVTLNRLDFPKLASGINNIQLGSGISKVKITPRWWRL